MVKAIIVYKSTFGNTKLAAETIFEGMGGAGVETVLTEIKAVDPESLAGFDAILVGSPNHIGNATRSIRKFIDKLGQPELKGKSVAVFDTYIGGDFEKAVKKMEKQLGEKAPGLKILAPGLSVRVEGVKGPISRDELPKCKEFGARIAEKLTG
jgi:flavodoxin I